eukprot:528891-Amorphochlora_amoeboformis.AAC.1
MARPRGPDRFTRTGSPPLPLLALLLTLAPGKNLHISASADIAENSGYFVEFSEKSRVFPPFWRSLAVLRGGWGGSRGYGPKRNWDGYNGGGGKKVRLTGTPGGRGLDEGWFDQ